jgi:hypothetical protein
MPLFGDEGRYGLNACGPVVTFIEDAALVRSVGGVGAMLRYRTISRCRMEGGNRLEQQKQRQHGPLQDKGPRTPGRWYCSRRTPTLIHSGYSAIK